jgi:uncharacterized coiled-coil protein SlyX
MSSLTQMSEPQGQFDELQRRMTAVEELLMHFESKLEALDEVIQRQQGQLTALEEHFRRWMLTWDEAANRDGLPPRLEDEKPPHY